MATTYQLLDDAFCNLKQHPDWTHKHLAMDLQERHGLTESKAVAIARRVLSRLEQDSRKWHRPRRSRFLSGETSGVFDNVVRALEDADRC